MHFGLAAFVTIGFFIIPIGYRLGWNWIRKRSLRLLHLFFMGVITTEAILGLTCPLTVLENMFRDVDYSMSFMSYWVAEILYWDLPSQVFVLLYSLCFGWVLTLWKICPPIERVREVYWNAKLFTHSANNIWKLDLCLSMYFPNTQVHWEIWLWWRQRNYDKTCWGFMLVGW